MQTILTSLLLAALLILPGCITDRAASAIGTMIALSLETTMVAPPLVAYRQAHGRWPRDWAEVAATTGGTEPMDPDMQALTSSMTFEVVPGRLAVRRRGTLPAELVEANAKQTKSAAPTTTAVEDRVIVSFIISDDSTLERIRILSPSGGSSGLLLGVRSTDADDDATPTTLPVKWSMTLMSDAHNLSEDRLHRGHRGAGPSTCPTEQ